MRRLARALKDQSGVLWADADEPLGKELETRFGLTPGEYLLLSRDRAPLQKGFFPNLTAVKRALMMAGEKELGSGK